jgi:hypothetical protein
MQSFIDCWFQDLVSIDANFVIANTTNQCSLSSQSQLISHSMALIKPSWESRKKVV